MSSWAMAKMLPMTRTARSPAKTDKETNPRRTRIRAVDVARERRLRDEFKPQLRADADERRGPLRRRATDRLLPRVDGVAVPRRANRAPPRRLRGLLGRRRAAARGRPVGRVVLVGAYLVRGDLGLGERRPRRHALEELAGRDGVLHRLRRGELTLRGLIDDVAPSWRISRSRTLRASASRGRARKTASAGCRPRRRRAPCRPCT